MTKQRFSTLLACATLLTCGAGLVVGQMAPKKTPAAASTNIANMPVEELQQMQLPVGATPKVKRLKPFMMPRTFANNHADLIVEDMILTSQTSSQRTYRFKIKNAGGVASGTFRATVACTPENVSIGTSQYNYLAAQWCHLSEGTFFQAPSIPAGGTQVFLSVKVNFPPLYPCSQPTAPRPRIFINVDSLDEVDEGSPAAEDNNEDSFVVCY